MYSKHDKLYIAIVSRIFILSCVALYPFHCRLNRLEQDTFTNNMGNALISLLKPVLYGPMFYLQSTFV